ncbi:MAG: hypothetical protein AAB408_05000 [Patescibacteria group bacterium]
MIFINTIIFALLGCEVLQLEILEGVGRRLLVAVVLMFGFGWLILAALLGEDVFMEIVRGYQARLNFDAFKRKWGFPTEK